MSHRYRYYECMTLYYLSGQYLGYIKLLLHIPIYTGAFLRGSFSIFFLIIKLIIFNATVIRHAFT